MIPKAWATKEKKYINWVSSQLKTFVCYLKSEESEKDNLENEQESLYIMYLTRIEYPECKKNSYSLHEK